MFGISEIVLICSILWLVVGMIGVVYLNLNPDPEPADYYDEFGEFDITEWVSYRLKLPVVCAMPVVGLYGIIEYFGIL